MTNRTQLASGEILNGTRRLSSWRGCGQPDNGRESVVDHVAGAADIGRVRRHHSGPGCDECCRLVANMPAPS